MWCRYLHCDVVFWFTKKKPWQRLCFVPYHWHCSHLLGRNRSLSHARAHLHTHTHTRTTFCSSTLPPSGRQRSWPMHWAEASGSTCWQSVLHVGTALQRQVSRWVQKEVRVSDHSGVWQRSRPLMSGHQIDNLFIKPYKRKSKSDVALKQINIACSYWLCQILFSLYDNL